MSSGKFKIEQQWKSQSPTSMVVLGNVSAVCPNHGLCHSSASGLTSNMACSSSGVYPSRLWRSHTKRYT